MSMDYVKCYQIDDSSVFSTTCETLVILTIGSDPIACHVVHKQADVLYI